MRECLVVTRVPAYPHPIPSVIIRFIMPSLLLALSLLVAAPLEARETSGTDLLKKLESAENVLVIDGGGIHTVGRLQMHVCNWGSFGSHPDDRRLTSDSRGRSAGSSSSDRWTGGRRRERPGRGREKGGSIGRTRG